jgi:glycosyltransferase involved in cell wall biosynthesis
LRGTPRISVFLLVRSLEIGGAERQLVQLALGLHERGHNVHVGLFYRRGALLAELEHAGIPVIDVAKKGRWDLVGFLIRLRKLVREIRPEMIYSFLGGANIVAAAVRPLVPGLKLAWSVRASDMDLSRYDWTHRMAYRVERLMSRIPDVIIANSKAGRDFAVRNGFPPGRIRIVPNGIDVDRFKPDAALRRRQRETWKLSNGQIAIGVLARLDPMKDHPNFLRAAAILAELRPDLRFICVGDGPERKSLEDLSVKLGIGDRVLFPGSADPVSALNGFDLACSSSITESFPNAVAEAMACGLPCVVTDAGDSAIIVGDTATIIATRQPPALADAVLRELEALTASRKAAARERIVQTFSVDAMVEQTLMLLAALVRVPGAA